MMKKRVLTILLTATVFLAAAFMGIATVFRVNSVAVEFSLASTSSQSKAEQLRAQLYAEYNGKSIFRIDEKKAKGVFENSTYFRMLEFRKEYPNQIVVKVVEDREIYAVKTGEEYYILNADGLVVEKRKSSVNRLDGVENMLVEGFTLTGKKGEKLGGDSRFDELFTFCTQLDKQLGGIRKNIVKAEVLTGLIEPLYRFTTREGVKLYVDKLSELTEEKAKTLLNAYLSLSDGQRMVGCISVYGVEGKASSVYSPTDRM